MPTGELIMIAILFGFLAFLLYQLILAVYVYIHKDYSWIYRLRIYSLKMPDLTKSPYYGMKFSIKQNMRYYPTIDDPVLKEIADSLNYLSRNMSDKAKANFILKFVQENIRYVSDREQYDSVDYWQFPVNTLSRKKGDCEDSAFLCTALMCLCGLDAVNVHLTTHMTSAVKEGWIGKHYILDNTKYYRAETTSAFIQYVGINIGDDNKLYDIAKPEIPSESAKRMLIEE